MSPPMRRFTAHPDRRLSSTGSWDRLRRGRPSSRAAASSSPASRLVRAKRVSPGPSTKPLWVKFDPIQPTIMAGLVPAMTIQYATVAGRVEMEISLAGRTAVVTGGSRGIGLAVATRFAASGADVAIVARGRETLDQALKTIGAAAGARVVAVQGDVAAIAGIRLTRLVWPQMKERRWGRILNTLNIGAKAPRPASAPTSVTRAAGMALTKVLASEGAPHNVLVNALLIGFIEADQHVRAAAKAGIPHQDYMVQRSKEIPLGRPGRAEEFANLACFLASDAGSYITGTAINVDGGMSRVV